MFIKELTGFSGATISLMKDSNGKLFVRKEGNITRNYEKLKLLDKFKVPKVYDKTDNCIDMEYLEGIDIAQYLVYYNNLPLIDFIIETIRQFKETSLLKDYTPAYSKHLDKVDYSDLPFTKDELINKLPTMLPQSLCHGDFTLENILYTKTNEFYLIDCSTGEYDSWIFDIAKMRQDLDAQWFIRNTNLKLDSILLTIKNKLKEEFLEAFDDNIYILMLLRVFIYCQPHSPEYTLLLTEIKKLWK